MNNSKFRDILVAHALYVVSVGQAGKKFIPENHNLVGINLRDYTSCGINCEVLFGEVRSCTIQ